MVKQGSPKSLGAPESEVLFTSTGEDIELVFEVSASPEGGLHASPWLSTENSTGLFWLIRNIGMIFLGFIFSLFIFHY